MTPIDIFFWLINLYFALSNEIEQDVNTFESIESLFRSFQRNDHPNLTKWMGFNLSFTF